MTRGFPVNWTNDALDLINQFITSKGKFSELQEDLNRILPQPIGKSVIHKKLKEIRESKVMSHSLLLPEVRSVSNLLPRETGSTSNPALPQSPSVNVALEYIRNAHQYLTYFLDTVENEEIDLVLESEMQGSSKVSKFIPVDHFQWALNSRLINNLIVLEEDERSHQYKEKNSSNDRRYFYCIGCQSAKNLPLAEGNQSPGSSGYLLNNTFYLKTNNHHPLCSSLRTDAHTIQQLLRKAMIRVVNGTKPVISYYYCWKEAKKNEIEHLFPPYFAIRKRFSRWRLSVLPSMKLGEIPTQFYNLGNRSCDRWLLFDTVNVTVFATDQQLISMAKALILAVDGTFFSSPRGTVQTLYIHALLGSDDPNKAEWKMMLMAIVMDKSENSYNTIVKLIIESWKRLNVIPTFERLHLDFEPALYNAFKKLNGSDKVRGCYFHFCKNIFERGRTLGLVSYYLKRGIYNNIRLFMKILMSLPLVPKEDAKLLWKYRLKDYYKRICPPEYNESVHGRWPLSELQQLSSYVGCWLDREDDMLDLSHLRRARNTNCCENYHRQLNEFYGTKPTLPEFISTERIRFEIEHNRLLQIESGMATLRPRKKKYLQLDERLQKLEAKYDNEMKSVSFLRLFF